MKGPVARGKELGLKVIKDPRYYQHFWIDGIKGILEHSEASMVLRGYALALKNIKEKKSQGTSDKALDFTDSGGVG